MKFSQYFQEWLYGDDGYYAKWREIGKNGDFYTSVSSSMFFGGSIANRFLKSLDENFFKIDGKKIAIVEVGAHKGYLISDFISFLFTLRKDVLDNISFYVKEPFKANIDAQNEHFKHNFGNDVKIQHIVSFSEIIEDEAFIFANELFDAFPCELIKDDKMLFAKIDNNCTDGNIKFYFDTIDEKTKKYSDLFEASIGEVAIGYEEFAEELNQFSKYEFVTFDYGENFARNDFSIRVYKEHKVYPFFELAGFVGEGADMSKFYKKSDITYDVNFLHLTNSFEMAGATKILYSSQASALVSFGITDLLEILRQNVDEKSFDKELGNVKRLIHPSFFGERFKCMIFRRSV